MGNLPLEAAYEQLQASDRAPRQIDPRVSELPRGNELSQDHVNRLSARGYFSEGRA